MPSLGDCVIGAQSGLGWVAAPHDMLKGPLETGSLAQIGSGRAQVEKAFYWHLQQRLEEVFTPLITALNAEPA